MAARNNMTRRAWTLKETRALLSCYAARKHEFENIRKKKYAYQNLVEDLTSMGVLSTPITSDVIENKIKSLLRAYKSSIDNNKKTGAPRCIEPFAEEMDEIFGAGACSAQNIDHVVTVGQSRSTNSAAAAEQATLEVPNVTSANKSQLGEVDQSPEPVPQKRIKKNAKQVMFETKMDFLREKEESKKARWEEKKKLLIEIQAKKDERQNRKEKMLSEITNFLKNSVSKEQQ